MRSAPAAVCFPLIAGASANNATAIGGAFCFNVNNAPANANWNNGCGHSYQKKKVLSNNALHNPHLSVKIARYRAGIVSREGRHEISAGDKKA